MNTPVLIRNIVAVAAILIAFFAGSYVMKVYKESTPAAKEAKAMESQFRPSFVLPALNGEMHNIDEWNGRLVVVNFWATWCPPCIEEMPHFIELQEKHGAEGLQFVGIAIDQADKVEEFIRKMGVNYPILLGDDEAIKVSDGYGNRLGALPYTAIIDRSGIIVKTYRGKVSQDSVEKVIKKYL